MMSKRGLILFVLALALVVASALVWLRQRAAWQPLPPLKPELPRVAGLPAPGKPVIDTALAQPLFWPSRRPNPVVKADAEAPKSELDDTRLTAVLRAGESQIAILQQKDGTAMKLSNHSTPWRIESFDGRKAVFVSNGDQRVERSLEPATPAARGPASPAPTPTPAQAVKAPVRAAPTAPGSAGADAARAAPSPGGSSAAPQRRTL